MTVLLDTGAAHAAFGIQPATLRQWASRGKLEAVATKGRRRLYRATDIEALMQDQRPVSSPTLELRVTCCHTS